MRNIKRTVKEAIDRVFENFDFDYYIAEAIENMDLEDIINDRIADKVSRVDFEPLVESLVKDYVSEEIESLDIEAEILDALEEKFNN